MWHIWMKSLNPSYSHFIANYMDDILVFFDNLQEHIQHLIEFAALVRKQGISLLASDTKFQIAVTGIGFLGITTSNNEIKMEPCMIQKVQRFQRIFIPV